MRLDRQAQGQHSKGSYESVRRQTRMRQRRASKKASKIGRLYSSAWAAPCWVPSPSPAAGPPSPDSCDTRGLNTL